LDDVAVGATRQAQRALEIAGEERDVGGLDRHVGPGSDRHAEVGNKPTRWVVARYFDRFNKARQDRWVFGDRASGAYLHKLAWTNIVRHQIVDGAASPDDPALADSWAKRRRKTPLPIDKTSRWLLTAQDGQCPICREALLPDHDRPQTPHEWERWLATTRKTITKVVTREAGTPDEHEPRLIHADCRQRSRPALLPPTSQQALLEPGARKPARPVLRGAGRSDASGLPVQGSSGAAG
jgi:hypothetical protein